MTSTSAVLVTHNNESTIVDCLESLANQVDEIIVFDNASSDKTKSIIRDQFPKVNLIASEKNLGYGSAINQAAKSVTSDFLLGANADVTFSPSVVSSLAKLMDNSSCGIVGPRIVNTDGSRYPSPRQFPQMFDAIGHGFVGLFNPDNRWSKRYLLDNEIEETQSVDWVSGSCFLIRKHTFDELNGFDERFFMYMEDVDLCRRAHELGWQVWFCADVDIIHVQGASSSSRPLRSVIAHHRSMFQYVNVSTGGIKRLLLPVMWVGIAARALIVLAKTALERRPVRHRSE